MAAIGKIRSWGPWLVGIIALALFGFIAGDMWRSCETTSNMSRQQAGEVMDQKLNIQDYSAMVEEYQEGPKLVKEILSMMQDPRAEMINDNQSSDDLDMIRDQVWESFIQRIVIGAEAKKLGLMVTDNELAAVLQKGTSSAIGNVFQLIYPYYNMQTRQLSTQPLFFDQQMHFDYQQVKQLAEVLKKQGETNAQFRELSDRFQKYWLSVEKELREQLLIQKYQALLAACMQTNKVSAQAAFNAGQSQSRVHLAFYPYASINDNDVKISDDELKQKYDEKKEAFKLYAETRDVKYVSYQILPSEADKAKLTDIISEAAMQLEKDSMKAEDVVRKYQSQVVYNGLAVSSKYLERQIPGINAVLDSMAVGDVSEIFQSNVAKRRTNPEERIKTSYGVVKLMAKPVLVDSVQIRVIPAPDVKTADSIMQVIRGGQDFDSVAISLFNRPAEKEWLTIDAMFNQSMTPEIKAYWEELLSLRTGDLKAVAHPQNPNARFVVEATDSKSAKQLFDVAIVIRELDASNETYNDEFNKFSQFVSENQTIENLEKNAAKNNYVVNTQNDVTTATHNIGGISGTHPAIKWAFEAKEGAVSTAYERCGNNDKFVVVALQKIHEKGYRDFESVKEQLRAEVLVDKKYEMIAKKLNGVKSVADAQAKDAAVQTDTIAGIKFSEPASLGSLGNFREPALSGAVAATAPGAFSKNVVKGNAGAYVFQVLDRTNVPGEFKDAEQQKMLRNQQRRIVSLAYSELKNKAEIVDNRYLFR